MDGGGSGRAQLAFAAAILVALAAMLAIAGPTAGDDTGPRDAEKGLDPAALTRISVAATPLAARRVERLRELEFEHVPEPEVVTGRYLNRLGRRELRRAGRGLGIAGDDAVGRITGLIEPAESLGAAYGSTGDLAAAAYDPRTDRLYVVSDAVAANRALIEFVLAHELDHALEDDRFGLPEGRGLDDDAALAEQALIEGSATAVMTDYAVAHIDALELLSAAETVDTGTGEVPRVFVDQLTWSYLGGLRFVNELRDLAGGWKLVDYALESRPPASTEQVLHADKYVRDERPAPVRIEATVLRARGWRLADRALFGELTTSLLLELGVEPADARDAAAGWDGDRYELWRRAVSPAACEGSCRSQLVLVARWAWDSQADRRRFAGAVAAYVEDGLDGGVVANDTWRIEGGFAALVAGGREAVLVFAPGEEEARTIAAAQLEGRAETIRP